MLYPTHTELQMANACFLYSPPFWKRIMIRPIVKMARMASVIMTSYGGPGAGATKRVYQRNDSLNRDSVSDVLRFELAGATVALFDQTRLHPHG